MKGKTTMRSRVPSISERTSRALVLVMLVLTVIGAKAQNYTFSLVHTFKGDDGENPSAGLVRDSESNLYGTTGNGGTPSANCPSGCGTVFKINHTTGKETVEYSFTGPPDGRFPQGVIRDGANNIYGITVAGGTSQNCCGTVFKFDPTNGVETVLYSFNGDTDGGGPIGNLIRDSAGNLYGITAGGSSGFGAVFKVDTHNTETVLYTFTGGADGGQPEGRLLMDAGGNIYGTTFYGGNLDCTDGTLNGCGVIFKLDTSNHETVLYSFADGGGDGRNPAAGLTRDASGNFYGTTFRGGSGPCNRGCGAVYKFDPTTSAETVLYSFRNSSDGKHPISELVRDAKGNLYGTAGGAIEDSLGVVFRVDPSKKQTVLHRFHGKSDGEFPNTGLVLDAAGNLYGTVSEGGPQGGRGVVFKLHP
jgi:uncharacterized repeat protein (TIGR03803 family)